MLGTPLVVGLGGSRLKVTVPDPTIGPLTAKARLAAVAGEVRDAEGRRRFHGAMTGGWSAGYHNTVGSAEGWAPTPWVSSRGSKAGPMRVQTPSDFMDCDDDTALAGAELRIIGNNSSGASGGGAGGGRSRENEEIHEIFSKNLPTRNRGEILLTTLGVRPGGYLGPIAWTVGGKNSGSSSSSSNGGVAAVAAEEEEGAFDAGRNARNGLGSSSSAITGSSITSMAGTTTAAATTTTTTTDKTSLLPPLSDDDGDGDIDVFAQPRLTDYDIISSLHRTAADDRFDDLKRQKKARIHQPTTTAAAAAATTTTPLLLGDTTHDTKVGFFTGFTHSTLWDMGGGCDVEGSELLTNAAKRYNNSILPNDWDARQGAESKAAAQCGGIVYQNESAKSLPVAQEGGGAVSVSVSGAGGSSDSRSSSFVTKIDARMTHSLMMKEEVVNEPTVVVRGVAPSLAARFVRAGEGGGGGGNSGNASESIGDSLTSTALPLVGTVSEVSSEAWHAPRLLVKGLGLLSGGGGAGQGRGK